MPKGSTPGVSDSIHPSNANLEAAGRAELLADDRRGRGDRDDKPGALGAHAREHGARDVHRAEQVRFDLRPDVCRAELLEEPGVEVAGVVHQHIETTEAFDGAVDRGLGVGWGGDVELDGQEVLGGADGGGDLLRVASGRDDRMRYAPSTGRSTWASPTSTLPRSTGPSPTKTSSAEPSTAAATRSCWRRRSASIHTPPVAPACSTAAPRTSGPRSTDRCSGWEPITSTSTTSTASTRTPPSRTPSAPSPSWWPRARSGTSACPRPDPPRSAAPRPFTPSPPCRRSTPYGPATWRPSCCPCCASSALASCPIRRSAKAS